MNTLTYFPGLRPPPVPAAEQIWSLIPWPVRQALRFRNRSPFEFPDGSEGVFCLVGPSAACVGVALYFDRRGILWAELHRLLCAKGLGSKLLEKEAVCAVDQTLLQWAVKHELST